MYKLVNWHDENLSAFYGDNNKGYIFGIYYYEDPEDFPTELEWFNSEETRAAALLEIEAGS
jgi:hypothetical protein